MDYSDDGDDSEYSDDSDDSDDTHEGDDNDEIVVQATVSGPCVGVTSNYIKPLLAKDSDAGVKMIRKPYIDNDDDICDGGDDNKDDIDDDDEDNVGNKNVTEDTFIMSLHS